MDQSEKDKKFQKLCIFMAIKVAAVVILMLLVLGYIVVQGIRNN